MGTETQPVIGACGNQVGHDPEVHGSYQHFAAVSHSESAGEPESEFETA